MTMVPSDELISRGHPGSPASELSCDQRVGVTKRNSRGRIILLKINVFMMRSI
jgi:hypothetical protein